MRREEALRTKKVALRSALNPHAGANVPVLTFVSMLAHSLLRVPEPKDISRDRVQCDLDLTFALRTRGNGGANVKSVTLLAARIGKGFDFVWTLHEPTHPSSPLCP
jgi:hypothetical protein